MVDAGPEPTYDEKIRVPTGLSTQGSKIGLFNVVKMQLGKLYSVFLFYHILSFLFHVS